MNGFARVLAVVLFGLLSAFGAEKPVVESTYAKQDAPLQLDPASPFWSASRPTYMEKDSFGKPVPGHRSEVRTRWTNHNLYFLFICPYEQLHLKPSPDPHQETNELWNWDVAEVFISSDFSDIKRYQEFEVSPQSEWIDLDIDLNKPHHEGGWTWNSEFAVSARIDATTHQWYAAMRIPLSAIDKRSPAAGIEFRMNLFVSEGPPSNHHAATWQPPMSNTFHVPERFGLLRLVSEKR
jgi:hypothetical protein